MRSRRLSAVILVLGSTGCTPGEWRDVIDHTRWEAVDAADDPFDDRPDVVDCPASAWEVEVGSEPSLEVDTGLCNYLALVQPSLVAIEADEGVEVTFRHGDLESEEAAEAHFAIRIGDLEVEHFQPIPSAEASYVEPVVAAEALPEGTPIWLHLHNHGANIWNLDAISAGPQEDP